TGKSRVVVELIRQRLHPLTLILCPLSVVPVWEHQFAMHAGGMRYRLLRLDEGSVKKKERLLARFLKQPLDAPRIVVCNYESAWRKPLSSALARLVQHRSPPLADAPPAIDFFVCDEIHRLKSPRGRASFFAWQLSQWIPWRLGLTGTPMPHDPLDIFGQCRALDARTFGTNYWSFRARYAVLKDQEVWNGEVRRVIKKVVGFQNMDEFQDHLGSICYQSGPEVLDLPPVMHEVIPCRLGAESQRLYCRLEHQLQAACRTGQVTVANALVRLLRLQQITSGFTVTTDDRVLDLDDAKFRALYDFLEDLPATEPVVMFARFTRDLMQIARAAVDCGRPYWEISGQYKYLTEWQRDAGKGAVLGVQIQAGGLGIDLTAARYAVYWSLGFSLGDYEQSLARLHRPGQQGTVHYYHLICQGTVDEKVYRVLRERKQVVESILDMWKEEAEPATIESDRNR
ncbi:MAG: SNF2-related protein, partial [Tepidisphaeraceae bacterium]